MDERALVEVCAKLLSLGFYMKTFDITSTNGEDDETKIVIHVQSAGVNIVMDNVVAPGSCPYHQAGGLWEFSGLSGVNDAQKSSGLKVACTCPTAAGQVSGTLDANTAQQSSGLKVLKKSGSGACSSSTAVQVAGTSGRRPAQKDLNLDNTILGPLPMSYWDRISKELSDILRGLEDSRMVLLQNATMVDLGNPKKRHLQIKRDAPTRFRSLDTLLDENTPPLSSELQKVYSDTSMEKSDQKEICRRQRRWSVGSVERSGVKTSSPFQQASGTENAKQ